MQVEWDRVDAPIERARIAEVEQDWGVRFPDDYVQCVLVNSGGSPIPAYFSLGETEEVFNRLLSFKPPIEWRAVNDNIMEDYVDLARQNLLPEQVYPFADDPFGNYLAFDYRTSAHEPRIVFLAHETLDKDNQFTAYDVCATFTDLLDSLHDSEDDK